MHQSMYFLLSMDDYGDGYGGGFIAVDGEPYCGNNEWFITKNVELWIESDCSPVTIELNTKDWAEEITWSFGSDCTSDGSAPYSDNSYYAKVCCLTAGTYTLTCSDSGGESWGGAYITINGNEYCRSTNWASNLMSTVSIGTSGQSIDVESISRFELFS